ncbi:MAG: hypothetical protein U9Q40_02655 [Campylobacterota bacterium]|nr:hypothetical protein [Campylobacterota bacterium]
MNTIQMLNNLTVADLIAAGILSYFVNMIVQKAYSLPAQLFWLGVALFGFYKIYSSNIPIVSSYSVVMFTIFVTILPVVKRVYYLFVKAKNKVFFKCTTPDAPVQKFASGKESIEKKLKEEKLKEEKQYRSKIYMGKLINKISDF